MRPADIGLQLARLLPAWIDPLPLDRAGARRLILAGDVRERLPRAVKGAVRVQDAARVVDRWSFPLGRLDLSEKKVSVKELEAERERRSAELAF